ncbi:MULTISPECIES: hypothetical protein [unclassified Streptomyces]|uniref:hypothetical protein n=1 Tax=unclassified Streptomyces TaxID=2593676 RepID=UPI003655A0E9
MLRTVDNLLHFTPSTADRIADTTALSASLAAVSLAIFLVLPTFRLLVTKSEQLGYSDYIRIRSLFRGFTILGGASILFTVSVILGIAGAHWPCKLILLSQETFCILGLTLSIVAIIKVWTTISINIKADSKP